MLILAFGGTKPTNDLHFALVGLALPNVLTKPKLTKNFKMPFIFNCDLTFGGTKPTEFALFCRFGHAKRFNDI